MLQQSNYNSSEDITVDDLPVLSAKGRTGEALADTLTELLARGEGQTSLRLPSLVELAAFYNCTHMDVYDALRSLKARGYEYHLKGIDNPVGIWRVSP